MFFPEARIRVQVYGCPVDLRQSFDGLIALTRHALREDPVSGQLFVFFNRRSTLVKVLCWDRSGKPHVPSLGSRAVWVAPALPRVAWQSHDSSRPRKR
jgi:transposase